MVMEKKLDGGGIFIRIWRRSEVSRENRIIQCGGDEKNRWQGIT